MRYIWVVAGSQIQVPLIQEVRRRGYRALVTDGKAECIGRLYADRFEAVDTYDVVGHVELARQIRGEGEQITAILTAGADIGPTVSAVAEELGLPAAPYDVAVRCRDKTQMRVTLKAKHPMSVSCFYNPVYKMPSISIAWDHGFGIPLVVKPADNCGTRGITVLRGYDEESFQQICAKAAAANKIAGRILIEELLHPVYEVATDSLVWEGKAHFANGVYRFFRRRLGFGLEAGHLNPLTPDDDLLAKIQDAATKLGVTWGPFKADFIKDRRYGWVLVECATRLSGAFDSSHAAPLATGRDVLGAMLDIALGLPLDKAKLEPKWQKWCFTYAPIYAPGPICGWKDKSDGLPGIKNVFIRLSEEIPAMIDCAARPVFIQAVGDTWWQAMARATRVARVVQPRRILDAA